MQRVDARSTTRQWASVWRSSEQQLLGDPLCLIRGEAIRVDPLGGRETGLDGQDEPGSTHGTGRRGDDAGEDLFEILARDQVADRDLESLEAALQHLHLHLELVGSTSRLVGRLPRHSEPALRRTQALTLLLDDPTPAGSRRGEA